MCRYSLNMYIKHTLYHQYILSLLNLECSTIVDQWMHRYTINMHKKHTQCLQYILSMLNLEGSTIVYQWLCRYTINLQIRDPEYLQCILSLECSTIVSMVMMELGVQDIRLFPVLHRVTNCEVCPGGVAVVSCQRWLTFQHTRTPYWIGSHIGSCQLPLVIGIKHIYHWFCTSSEDKVKLLLQDALFWEEIHQFRWEKKMLFFQIKHEFDLHLRVSANICAKTPSWLHQFLEALKICVVVVVVFFSRCYLGRDRRTNDR